MEAGGTVTRNERDDEGLSQKDGLPTPLAPQGGCGSEKHGC